MVRWTVGLLGEAGFGACTRGRVWECLGAGVFGGFVGVSVGLGDGVGLAPDVRAGESLSPRALSGGLVPAPRQPLSKSPKMRRNAAYRRVMSSSSERFAWK